jgi:hypothetical protein
MMAGARPHWQVSTQTSVPPRVEWTLSTPASCRNRSRIPLRPTPKEVSDSEDIPFIGELWPLAVLRW